MCHEHGDGSVLLFAICFAQESRPRVSAINDGATGGSVYLYHFNLNNIKNTDGLGKVFYLQ